MEVTYSECCRDGVEVVVRVGEGVAVFFCKSQLQLFFLCLLSCHFEHSLADVDASDVSHRHLLRHLQCQIAGACCYIKDGSAVSRHIFVQGLDGSVAPVSVNVPRKAMVQHVVGGSDVVEHLLHLTCLVALRRVGLYFFLLIHFLVKS